MGLLKTGENYALPKEQDGVGKIGSGGSLSKGTYPEGGKNRVDAQKEFWRYGRGGDVGCRNKAFTRVT